MRKLLFNPLKLVAAVCGSSAGYNDYNKKLFQEGDHKSNAKQSPSVKSNLMSSFTSSFNFKGLSKLSTLFTVHADPGEPRQPLKLIPTNNPLIPLRTEGNVKLAEYNFPPSAVKNFYIGIDGSRFMNPDYTVTISKLPDEMQIKLDYNDIKDLPLFSAQNQNYPCNSADKDKLTVFMDAPHVSLDKHNIKNVEDYVDYCTNVDGFDGNPFKGIGHYEELHAKLCEFEDGTPRFYPEGLECSFAYDNKLNDFFLRNLPDLFFPLRIRGEHLPGIGGSYVYVGGRGCAFPIHGEDGLLFSLNYMPIIKNLPCPGVKIWISFNVQDQDLADQYFKDEHPNEEAKTLSKNLYLKDLGKLAERGIRFQVLCQEPGTLIITNGIHAGLNTGICINEALNAATVEWAGFYHRFELDARLSKPPNIQISRIQVTKDFGVNWKMKKFIDGEWKEINENGVKLYNHPKKLAKMFMLSQILLHVYLADFERDPFTAKMSPIEKRSLIESIVSCKEDGDDFRKFATWVKVRRGMGAVEEGKSNCADELDSYIVAKDGVIYSDLPCVNESEYDTNQFASKLLFLHNNGWVSELVTFVNFNWGDDAFIFEKFYKSLAEQREEDPPGTWPNKYADTRMGLEARDFEVAFGENDKFPEDELPEEEDKYNDTGNLSDQKLSPSPPLSSISMEEVYGHAISVIADDPKGFSQALEQKQGLERESFVKAIGEALTSDDLDIINKGRSGSRSMTADTEGSSECESEKDNANGTPEIEIPEGDYQMLETVEDAGSIEPHSDEIAHILLTIDEELLGDASIPNANDPNQVAANILLKPNEETITNLTPVIENQEEIQIGNDFSNVDSNETARPSQSSTDQSTETKTCKKTLKRKKPIGLTQKERNSTYYSHYMPILQKHFNHTLTSPSPPSHWDSASGLTIELFSGKIKYHFKDPVKAIGVVKELIKEIGDPKFDPKTLLGKINISKTKWEKILRNAGFKSTEYGFLSKVIVGSLTGQAEYKSIEHLRLDFALRNLINALSVAAGKGTIPVSSNQESWIEKGIDKKEELGQTFKVPLEFVGLFQNAQEDTEWDAIVEWLIKNWDYLMALDEDMKRMSEGELEKEEKFQEEAKERNHQNINH